jgi:hypothetical protein
VVWKARVYLGGKAPGRLCAKDIVCAVLGVLTTHTTLLRRNATPPQLHYPTIVVAILSNCR